MEKIKVSEIVSDTMSYWSDKFKDFEVGKQIPDPLHVVVREIVRDGDRLCSYHCRRCGLSTEGAYNKNYTCACGNRSLFLGNIYYAFTPYYAKRRESNNYIFVDKTDEENFKIAYCFMKFYYGYEDKEIPRAEIFPIRYLTRVGEKVVCLDAEKGAQIRKPDRFDAFEINLGCSFDVTMIGATQNEYMELLSNARIQSESAAVKTSNRPSKQELIEKMRLNAKLKDWSNEIKSKMNNSVTYVLKDSVGPDLETYAFSCTCGALFEKSVPRGVSVQTYLISTSTVCPECGTNDFLSRYYNRQFYCFENSDLPDNDLIVRVYESHNDISMKNRTICAEGGIKEVFRYYINEKNTSLYSVDESGKLKKERCGHVYYYGSSSICPQTKAEIVDIFNKSSLNHMALDKALGLGSDSEPRWMISLNCLSTYVSALRKAPCIELLLKAGLYAAASDIYSNSTSKEKFAVTASTIPEVFGVSKRAIKFAQKRDLSGSQIVSLDKLLKLDPSVTYEVYDEFVGKYSNVLALTEIVNFGISAKRALEYLESVYNHQCIERHEALLIWKDYLQMAKRTNLDLSDKHRLFPSSLKKEHDIAMFAYKKVKDEIDRQTFIEMTNRVEERFGNYSYQDFFIMTPKTPEDVVAEASAQRNCLRSYLTSIRDGRTNIVFIRRKDEPDKSFVTCEVNNDGHLIQVKGFCNSNPSSPELVDFLVHWTKAKKITR